MQLRRQLEEAEMERILQMEKKEAEAEVRRRTIYNYCLLYTSPSPRDS